MAIVTSSMIGVNLNAYTTDAVFAKGTQVLGTDGSLFEYVNTLSAIAAFNAVCIDVDENASNLETTNAAITYRVGVAQISIAISTYGWVQRSGKMRVQVLANCNDFVPLFPTTTPGALDDATISAMMVLGLNTVTSTTTASAMTALGSAPLQILFYQNPA